jgi:predicted dehydrogenase
MIRTAIAGVGFIGPAHIEAIRRTPGVEVVAIMHPVLDECLQKAAQLGVPRGVTTFEELLTPDVDVVHICTPNNLHAPQAEAALRAGKHVICEKPLAVSIASAEALCDLADSTGLVNAVHFNLRYYPHVRQMRAMRLNGQLGRVYNVQGSYLQDWLYLDTDYNWRLEPDKSGDSRAIADIGSHLLDLTEYVTGLHVTHVMADFSTVHATRKKPLKPVETYSGKMLQPEDYADVPINTEDYASVLCRFDDGSKGVMTVSQVNAGRKNRLNIEIAGASCSMAWCSERPEELWIGHRDQPNQLMMRDPSLMHPDGRGITSLPGGHAEGFPDTSKQMFREIYAAIREGRQPAQPSYPTFRDGLRELVMCERIVESHRKQAWVVV